MVLKTAQEKAHLALIAWVNKTQIDISQSHFDELVAAVTRVLKEQDRDTRHACAEAVINADDPHGACMNVTAV